MVTTMHDDMNSANFMRRVKERPSTRFPPTMAMRDTSMMKLLSERNIRFASYFKYTSRYMKS